MIKTFTAWDIVDKKSAKENIGTAFKLYNDGSEDLIEEWDQEAEEHESKGGKYGLEINN